MPLIAKRKVRQTWREAVAARADTASGEILARFDALCGEGTEEGEAAYRALGAAGRLWPLDEPATDRLTIAPPDEVPAV